MGAGAALAGVGTSNGTIEKLLKFRIFCDKIFKKKKVEKGGKGCSQPYRAKSALQARLHSWPREPGRLPGWLFLISYSF